MNRALITLLAAGGIFVTSTVAVAEHHEDDGFLVIPVEMYACTYNGRNGPDDLDGFADDWNEWADANGTEGYSAWTLTPFYYGPGNNTGFDFIWLGAAKDAVALGKAQDLWMTGENELRDESEKLWTCDSHSNMASVNHKPTPQGKTPENVVMTFSDCNFKEGATFEALGEAMAAWSEYLGGKGSEAGIFHWYPVYGGGAEGYTFKWVEAHESLESLGADYEIFGNGRGYEKSGELFGDLLDCDESRVYLGKNRRYVQLR